MRKKFISLFVVLTVFLACGPGGNEENIESAIDSLQLSDEALIVTKEAMQDIVDNVASPVEMAALIKDVGVPFSLQHLCSTDNPDKYNTNFKQAIGLGFMGADLGYLNIYERTSQVVGYITVIKKLADALKIGQFFDFSTLKRLATNNENLDSLMFISVNSFNQMDNYLRENKRSDLSVLIVTGVWLEGIYLATQVIKEKPNPKIAERIGEQKIILDQLLLILKNFEKQSNFAELIADFETIKDAFKGVDISYNVGDPESKEVDGKLVIVQNETSIVEISKEDLNKVITIIETIRTKYTY